MSASAHGGLSGWIFHRLVANYWLLAVSATLLALPVALGILWLDRHGATAWLLARDLAPVATADTAKDFVGVAAGVNAAFITLYFSITLIVLSLAAGNLGVRLIDRWLERRLVRVSLAGLSFSLLVAFVAMLAIDAEAELADTPLLLVATVLLLQAVNVAMLAVSLHRLGRTIFVDDSIDRIAADARRRSLRLSSRTTDCSARAHTLRARREGYVEGIGMDELVDAFGQDGEPVTVHAAPGQHVVEGEILLSADRPFDEDRMAGLIPIGPYRSDNQGVVFRIRLLVEIAARALSPAINDFYTAITCADKLAAVIESQTDTWVDEGQVPVLDGAPWLILVGQDFRSLFDDPLRAFRQAACQYPSVAIRMIDNYARIASRYAENRAPAGLTAFLQQKAQALAEHAASAATLASDADDIRAAYRAGFAGVTSR